MLVICALLLSSCGSSATSSTAPVVRGSTSGWRTVTYGGLSFGLPPGWRLQALGNLSPCAEPPTDTVTVGSLSRSLASSCPGMTPSSEAPSSWVIVVCLRGQAALGASYPGQATQLLNHVTFRTGPSGQVLLPAGGAVMRLTVNILDASTRSAFIARIERAHRKC